MIRKLPAPVLTRRLSRAARKLSALSLAVGLFLFSAAACNGNGEELATYEGGNVTRGELRNMFEMIFGPEAQAQATIDQQNQLITNYALMKIAALEAQSQGLADSADVSNRTILKEEHSQLYAYNSYLRKNADDLELHFVEMQFLYLPVHTDPGGTSDSGAREMEGQDLLKVLNEKKDDSAALEDLIHKRTEHQRYKWLGGYLDPHCTSCTPNPLGFLTDPLKDAPQGEFILVTSPEAIWLVRKYREYDRSLDDVEDIFLDYHRKTMRIARALQAALPEQERDLPVFGQIILDDDALENLAKQQADRLQRTETNNLMTNRLNKLRETRKLELLPPSRFQEGHPDLEAQYVEGTALFTIGEKAFTYGDLNKTLKAAAETISLKEKLQIVNSLIVPTMLLEGESDFASVKGNDDYNFMLSLREKEALASVYYNRHQPAIEVTEAQIQEQYNIGRQNQFKGKSLGEVRASIRSMLEGGQRQQAQMKVQTELTQKYKLEIKRDLLKANEL